ncbi:MAG: hypothetical protein PHQ36_01800 [Anaerolineales bacterium]|nr:hypothetical protein [Anaerolineales bacterium]
MTAETAEIAQIIGLIITFLLALASWFKGTAERGKLVAETAVLYAELSDRGVKREKELQDQLDDLKKKISDQEKVITEQNEKIAELKKIIDQKDNRIVQLESLTVTQEKEIQKLRTELDTLRNNIK